MYTVSLPPIGEGIQEGEIVKWNVKPGDMVKKDDELVEVMTDKITVKIPSPVAGKIVKTLVSEGETAMIGDAILEIDSPDESNSPASDKNVESAPKQEVSISTDEKIPNVKATPAVRAYARSKNVDLLKVKPSSPDGRITREDIDRFTSQKPVEAPKPPAGKAGEDEIITPTGIRKIIFDKMTKSKQIIPHFTITDFVDTGNIEKAIKQYTGKRYLSFTAFFVKAVSVAFRDFPKLNAVYNESNKTYTVKKTYNIGVAVDSPTGLTVVVVRDAASKSIFQISDEIKDMAERARTGKLQLQDVQGSTFSVTNIGSIGGIMATPIINYPEVAILEVNSRTSAFENGELKQGLYLTLACDHRLIDGAEAARFLGRLKEVLEYPLLYIGD
ncbi:MAG: dihydrolipoamide acetyltransferase family protein [Ferroplasma sp.]|uniref:dihydrolipoamide acetyltransferase family protein n=1 Tax=Ferroplasma sp. TaxID=2591003 RepID=UPI0028169D97|nr:dihydrolipoamide acetyltransferase family protein [Ferroplasma sp.]WMT51489.1 MAG: dihydrolipoamide acetyltransferase family protein [Ferroplasma sp.]